MSDVLNVEVRENMGTAATRKLRDAGSIPAVVYGHGGENQHVSVCRKEVELLMRHHSKHVQLAGAASDHVLVKDVQWDPLGIEVLHMDLVRVSLTEKVTVTIAVKLHGVAIGLNHHGVMNEILHSVDILVPAIKIPEHVELNINDLDVGQSKTAADIELPEGATLVTDPTAVVVQMNAPAGDKGTDAEAEGTSEPEVIGAKNEDE
ncbi:50S ribosomal protein L25 [Rosistilla carotiformis]|uniref:Large ribosomal subunit protein bL25 n=1 Tax=Rosistilla carotiformis TaxID=2528017 RepID=A0A518JQC1_9BACT|nr:50S ribosomal protein L25 [Rosistilla carotiformis]QDV67736.1 50S ribosomal protein L25 [Rosistilla carotiformis]